MEELFDFPVLPLLVILGFFLYLRFTHSCHICRKVLLASSCNEICSLVQSLDNWKDCLFKKEVQIEKMRRELVKRDDLFDDLIAKHANETLRLKSELTDLNLKLTEAKEQNVTVQEMWSAATNVDKEHKMYSDHLMETLVKGKYSGPLPESPIRTFQDAVENILRKRENSKTSDNMESRIEYPEGDASPVKIRQKPGTSLDFKASLEENCKNEESDLLARNGLNSDVNSSSNSRRLGQTALAPAVPENNGNKYKNFFHRVLSVRKKKKEPDVNVKEKIEDGKLRGMTTHHCKTTAV